MSGMRQLEIRTRRMVNDSLAGAYHSVFKGRGMDFDEVREYSPGDEVRTIDWNVTARAGRTFVKKFTEERELTILLLVDISASGNFGSARHGEARSGGGARERPRLLRHPQQRQGRPGAVHRPHRTLPAAEEGPAPRAARGARHSLSHARRAAGTDTVKALDVVNHVLHRRAIVFLISDFVAPGDPSAVRAALLPRHAPDQSPPRSGRRARRGSAREGAPRRRHPGAGGCGDRRGHRTRYRQRRRAQALQSGGGGTQPAAGRSIFAPRASTRCSCKRIRRTSPHCNGSSRLASADGHEPSSPGCVGRLRRGALLARGAGRGGVPDRDGGAGEASEDIRDIRGPKLILPWWFVAAVIGGVLLIALLGCPPLAAPEAPSCPRACCPSRSRCSVSRRSAR